MAKGFAIHNAFTDHGGMIPATQMMSSQQGNLFVRAGDGHLCPKCRCWSTVIKGHVHVIFDGKPVAYVGDKLTCGATIMPQQTHVVGSSGLSYGQSQEKTNENKFISSTQKEIKEIFWSYGDDFIKLETESRHFVDMNLHVKTINYSEGEVVEITLKYDDGDFIFDNLKEMKVQGPVNANGEVVLKNVFKNKRLNLK